MAFLDIVPTLQGKGSKNEVTMLGQSAWSGSVVSSRARSAEVGTPLHHFPSPTNLLTPLNIAEAMEKQL